MSSVRLHMRYIASSDATGMNDLGASGTCKIAGAGLTAGHPCRPCGAFGIKVTSGAAWRLTQKKIYANPQYNNNAAAECDGSALIDVRTWSDV